MAFKMQRDTNKTNNIDIPVCAYQVLLSRQISQSLSEMFHC